MLWGGVRSVALQWDRSGPIVLTRNHVQEDELAEHALWCRRFASVNATGLRKIAKKHDKYAHNDAGKQFVRVWFSEGAPDLLFGPSRMPSTYSQPHTLLCATIGIPPSAYMC